MYLIVVRTKPRGSWVTQWAAVTTCLGPISEPPHLNTFSRAQYFASL